jgi:hypothetical protein
MSSLSPNPKPIFKNVVVALAGDLGLKNFDAASLDKYMTLWGGRFSQDFDESVTHLIANKKQWDDNVERGTSDIFSNSHFALQQILVQTLFRCPDRSSWSQDLYTLFCARSRDRAHRLTHVETVREARKNRKVEVVNHDWLDLSMNGGKKLDPADYSFKSKLQAANAKRRQAEKNDKGIAQGEKYVNTSKYLIDQVKLHL